MCTAHISALFTAPGSLPVRRVYPNMCCAEASWGSICFAASPLQVLRVHREKLAPPMRGLGDTYAGKEFREWGAASGVTQQQWHEFRSQWVRAAHHLPCSLVGLSWCCHGEMECRTHCRRTYETMVQCLLE